MAETNERRASGGCHCGAVRYEVRGPLRDVMVCHCSDCRRIHGQLAAHSATKWSNLEITRDDRLKWYQSSERARRAFCSECGSGLFFDLHGRDIVSICAGTLDPPTGIETAVHVFVESAADYERTDAEALRLDALPGPEDEVPFRGLRSASVSQREVRAQDLSHHIENKAYPSDPGFSRCCVQR